MAGEPLGRAADAGANNFQPATSAGSTLPALSRKRLEILNELRCECTFRSRPLVEAKAPTLAELEAEYAHTGPDLSKHAWAKTPAEQELAVLKAMQPPMTKQQLQADVIEIEINPRYRGPRESEGVHKETPAGSVPFLVQ